MKFAREGGILLHPTSLPGRFGIGDLGEEAFAFIHFLAGAGMRLWQILPLGPTGYGNSPYQTLSAFAGNELLVNPDRLVQEGLLSKRDVEVSPPFPRGRVDFGRVIPFKMALLRRAYETFAAGRFAALRRRFETFCHEHAHWLEDYALFRAIKSEHNECLWTRWPKELVRREPGALQQAAARLAREIDAIRFAQFLFFEQWSQIKQAANELNIQIIGDLPIFLAHDSADVWAHQELFFLDADGEPEVVAGVPPDYFSETGQRWGNPLYRWERMAEQGYAWWIERFHHTFRQVDIVRLDHFRGFEAYWEVPASEETAIHGRWVKGPGAHFLEAVEKALGRLPIIAEDLGIITEGVIELLRRFRLPGMRVLQFAFGPDEGNRYFLPHNYPRNCVVYTGTHDNDTCVGWFRGDGAGNSTLTQKEIAAERRRALRYLNSDGSEIHWDFIRLAFASVANTAIVPLQDVLGLGSEARMNLPGRPDGNWEWRFLPEQLTPQIQQRLLEMVELYERNGKMIEE